MSSMVSFLNTILFIKDALSAPIVAALWSAAKTVDIAAHHMVT